MPHSATASPQARRTTLRVRMTLWVTLLCVAILTLAGVTIYLGVRAALQQTLDSALLSIARSEVVPAWDEQGVALARRENEATFQLPTGSSYEKYAQVENSADRIVARTKNLAALPLHGEMPREQAARAGQIEFGDLRHGKGDLRALYYPFHDARGNSLIVILGVPKTQLRQSLHTLRNTLLLMLTVSALLAALGANLLARSLTQPLERMTREARRIDEDSLNVRLSAPGQDAELHDLAKILNAMIARLEAAFALKQRLMDSQQRFLADASHELRSPLANLRGTIEVTLRRTRAAEEYQEAFRASLIEIERLTRLVNDLLTLERVGSGQFSLKCAACDLADVARGSAVAYNAQAEQSDVRLWVDVEAGATVWGDSLRLRQIVDNVLENALRYAPAHSLVVLQVRRETTTALLTVRDTGPGLSAREQSAIFDRFYRSDRSRARHTGGLGLGLPIARALAEAHRGTLTVESVPGEGAAFTLALPSWSGESESDNLCESDEAPLASDA